METHPLAEEDRAILDLEGPTIVGHTCKVIGLRSTPSLEALRDWIDARLGPARELRRRLDPDAGDPPAWVDDDRFDVAHHVVAAGSAASEDELCEGVADLFAAHLDRERPLWRLDLIGLPEQRAALVWRIHHALADGTAAMRLGSLVLWEPVARQGATTAAPSHPKTSDSALDSAERRRHGHLGAMIEREFAESLHASPFDGEIGRRRAVAFADVPLGPLHDAARRVGGATVNDAVLSLVAGALGSWLRAHHEDLDSLRLRVPVSLHHEGDAVANRDSFFTIPAPVSEPDPLRRLTEIHRATLARKAGHDADQLEDVLGSLERVSGWARAFAERIEASPRSFALCVSNVPGPREPIAVCGSPVDSLHSLAEVGRRHGLRVTVVSLAGTLGFGFCADPGIVPDVSRLAAAVRHEADALIAAAGFA